MKKVLGISAFYHDSAAALVVNGEIIAAAQEERFTRKKHTPEFPLKAIEFCLREANISIEEVDAIVFYDKPLLKFERLLETYLAFAPKGVLSFVKAIPIWLKEKLFLKKLLHDNLKKLEGYDKKKAKLLFTEHHLAHGASAFYPSPFSKAAILTIDGVGEWSTASIAIGKDKEIKVLKEMHFPHSLGLLYSAFTYYLGFKVNSGEYKIMGLAPYGDSNSADFKMYKLSITSKLITINKDGSIWLNQDYFSYATGLRMVKEKKWEELFGLAYRKDEDQLIQQHCDLALALQKVTEEVVVKMAQVAKRLTSADYLCLAGGVALNCVANRKIQEANIFKEIFIQPAAGDAGGALGAALAASHIYFEESIPMLTGKDRMKNAYLGESFSSEYILKFLKKKDIPFTKHSKDSDFYAAVAKHLKDGKVVGWFQDKAEFGPRALGNRSILGSPSFPDMQSRLNMKIKFRESFRPFAPAVLKEDAQLYFDLIDNSYYMLVTAPLKKELCQELPSNYEQLIMKDKLAAKRSKFQAITHLDYSARVQTVDEESNEKFYNLLQKMKGLTGDGMLVNTSFNIKDEAIVNSPEHAYRCFQKTGMDVLVLGNFIIQKEKN